MPKGMGYPKQPGKTTKGQPDAGGPMPAKTSKGRPPTKKVTSAVSRSSVSGTYPVSSADE